MKKIILLICFSIPLFTVAQSKRIIKETFDNNKFRWDERYEKDYSTSIEDGFFILKSEKEPFLLPAVGELPINIEENFKITFKLIIPKLNNEYYFGIIFNYDDDNNFDSFLVKEKKYHFFYMSGGILNPSRNSGIILNSGKNKEVLIELEKKGSKLIFSVDHMEAASITRPLKNNTFGFLVENKNIIKVDEVAIELISND